MDRNNLVVTAYHEAGHAVLAWSCGIRVSEVSIVPNKDNLGRVRFSFTPSEQRARAEGDPMILRALSLVDLGGIAADYNHWKRFPNAEPAEIPTGHFDDQLKVRTRLALLGYHSETDFQAYLVAATRLIDQVDIWPVVDRVVTDLVSAGELNQSEIASFALLTPKIDKSFWDRIERVQKGFRDQA
jgi:hypothetical protein